MKVVILGGGLTGLSTAYCMLKAGHEAEIIERDAVTGGLAGTVEKGGYRFDYGPHLFHTREPETKRFFDEIVGPDVYELLKDNQIHFLGKYYSYPLKAPDIVKNLPKLTAVRCGVDFLLSELRRALFKPTFNNAEEWIRGHFGTGLYKLFFGPYTEKVWGRSPKELAASFAQHRIPPVSLREVILNYFKIADRGPVKDEHKFAPMVYKMYYPHLGSGVLTERLEAKVREMGGVIHLNAEPTAVEREGKKVTAVRFREGGEEKRIEGPDFVASTIPVTSLFPLFQPAPNAEILGQAASLEYRSILILSLMIKKERVLKHSTVYFTDKYFNRISDLTGYSPQTAPKGCSALSVEITCSPEEVESRTDEEVFEASVKGLIGEGFFTRDQVEGYFVMRVKNGYPVYSTTYEEAMAAIGRYFEDFENCLIAGRNGFFKYVDMHICIESGKVLTEFMISGKSRKEFRNSGNEIYFA